MRWGEKKLMLQGGRNISIYTRRLLNSKMPEGSCQWGGSLGRKETQDKHNGEVVTGSKVETQRHLGLPQSENERTDPFAA